MFDRLEAIEQRYVQLGEWLCDPAVVSDPEKLRKYSKEQSDLADTVAAYRQYRQAEADLAAAKQMLQEKLDEDMREFVKAEMEELTAQLHNLEHELQVLLLPKDPNDDKNVFLEIRAAAGGEEAALFAGDLLRMYTRYAENNGWKVEVIDANYTDMGGFREVTMAIHGKGAFSKLKFESGTHRVQR